MARVKTLDFSDKKNNVVPEEVFAFLSNLLNVKVVVEKLSNSVVMKYQARSVISNTELSDVKVSGGIFSGMGSLNNDESHETKILPTLFTCEMCQKTFGKKQSLKNHIISCKANRYSSNVAQKSNGSDDTSDKIKTKSVMILSRPSGTRAATTRYCSKCEKSVEHDEARPLQAIQTCTTCNRKLYLQCIKCNKQYRHYSDMAVHLKYRCDEIAKKSMFGSCKVTKESISRYCLKCEKSVKYYEYIGLSKVKNCKTCSSEMIWQCGRCGKRYKYYSSARKHVAIKCGEVCAEPPQPKPQSYDCDYRTVKLTNSPSERISIRKMTKFYCPKCDVVASNKKYRSIQSKSKCFKCNTTMLLQCKKCDKRYNNWKSMIYHLKVICYVSEVYECKNCKYKTAQRNHMIRHIKTHRTSKN